MGLSRRAFEMVWLDKGMLVRKDSFEAFWFSVGLIKK